MQQLTCNIDLSCSFYYLFFSFVLIELKTLCFEGESPGGKILKMCVGACAMTTKFLDNKNFHFQNFIVVAFPTKTSVFGRFSSLPPSPSPPQKRKIYFYCRLAVSECEKVRQPFSFFPENILTQKLLHPSGRRPRFIRPYTWDAEDLQDPHPHPPS